MLKNKYDIITNNFKCHKNRKFKYTEKLYFNVYNSLNDFIQKNKDLDCFNDCYNGNEFCFDDIFHDFISWVLYDLKIGKNDYITMLQFDDYFVIYTKNTKYEYVFYD